MNESNLRKQYLFGKISYEEYYTVLAEKFKEMGIKPKEHILEKMKNNTNISIQKIDRWAGYLIFTKRDELKEIFKSVGDQISLAGISCVLKQLCKNELNNK